ncbi:unnamed protein product [Closterium sp. Naga37s-1]|nr:unnamed protein product [Closterium sp. Naga37s-1]
MAQRANPYCPLAQCSPPLYSAPASLCSALASLSLHPSTTRSPLWTKWQQRHLPLPPSNNHTPSPLRPLNNSISIHNTFAPPDEMATAPPAILHLNHYTSWEVDLKEPPCNAIVKPIEDPSLFWARNRTM